jgi:hypothetical protein
MIRIEMGMRSIARNIPPLDKKTRKVVKYTMEKRKKRLKEKMMNIKNKELFH